MRLAAVLALALGACTATPDSGPALDPDPAAASGATLELRWSTGSLPPAYHSAETTRLGPDGGTFAVALSYGQGPDTTFAFPLAEAQRAALWADLDALGLWRTRWREDQNPPVGGSSWHLDARDGERRADVPPFVVSGQAEAKEALHDRVASAVPLTVRAAADAWRRAAQSRLREDG